jgi:hypothetical protein
VPRYATYYAFSRERIPLGRIPDLWERGREDGICFTLINSVEDPST